MLPRSQRDPFDLQSQWEGFGRFCRDRPGLEPLFAAEAFGLRRIDVEAALTVIVPASTPDEVEAAQWCRGWKRRFDVERLPIA